MPILAMDGRSLLFNVLYRVHAYQEWLMREPSISPMRFHRRFLQTLQHGAQQSRRKAWLLKTPWHMFTLDALWAVYPDAKIIMPHRDPAGMIASLSSLHARFNGICSDAVRPDLIGRFQQAQWNIVIDKFMKTREANPEKHVVDVQFSDLAADPVKVVRQVYAAFGLELSPPALENIRGYLNGTVGDGTGKRGAHGKHEYALEWFGLTEHDVMASPVFEAYCKRYSVPRRYMHSMEYGGVSPSIP